MDKHTDTHIERERKRERKREDRGRKILERKRYRGRREK